MRIVGFEYLKFIKNKVVLILAFILFAGSLFIYSQQLNKQDYADEYLSMINQKYIDSYQDFRDGISTKAEQMLKVSIFGKPGTFTYNNIVNAADAYEELGDIELSNEVSYAVESATTYDKMDFFIFGIVILVVFSLFMNSTEKICKGLVWYNKKGRLPVILSKITVAVTVSVVVTILMCICIIGIAMNKYGVGNLHASIQSWNSFQKCIDRIDVLQYLILYVAIKAAGFALISVILILLVNAFRNEIMSCIIGLLVFCISYVCYTVIGNTSYYNFFKFINVFAIINSNEWFMQYRNLNIFNNAIEMRQVLLVVMAVTFLACGLASIFLYVCNLGIQKGFSTEKVMIKIRKLHGRVFEGRSLALLEIDKIFISNGMILVLLLAGYIGLTSIRDYDNTIRTAEEASYRSINYEFNGIITAEEEQYFQSINESAGESTYSYETQEIALMNEDYDNYLSIKDVHDNAGIVNRYFSNDFFMDEDSMISNYVVFMILVIPVLTILFTYDYRNGMIKLIRTTSKGQNSYFMMKFIIGLATAVIVYIAVYATYYYNIFNEYSPKELGVAIQSIVNYTNSDVELTVKQVMLEGFIFQGAGLILISIIIMMVAVLVKNMFSGLITGFAVFIVPAIIQDAGLNIRSVSFNNIALEMNSLGNSQVVSIVNLACIIIITGVLFYYGKKSFIGGDMLHGRK